jgi:type II secretory pathway component PulC
LQKGDVILAINDVKMARTRDVRPATQSRRTFWKLTIGRAGQVLNTVISG